MANGEQAEAALPEVRLTPKGVRWYRTGHPWIYRNDLMAEAHLPAGELVAVADPDGRFLGQAFYSTASRIALRLITTGNKKINKGFWQDRLKKSLAYRRRVVAETNAYRLIYGEADGFPGLIVDTYAGHLALQTLHPGLERRLDDILEILVQELAPASITLRHDTEMRRQEGLPRTVETVYRELPPRVQVREGAVRLWADIRAGQKTGLFLDQRENRLAAARYSRGEILDAFAYQGAFAMHLAPRAERVTLVESSGPALALAQENAGLNGVAGKLDLVKANVFNYLKEAVADGRRFDLISLDPPAFAKSRRDREAAYKGYKEINRRALLLLSPGGVLVTSSCSYNLSEPEFLEVVREAAADAHRQARLVERRGAARDHPALLSLPESLYLKCLILVVE
jgi:23S rRNA (cytosine1962-C5)-methyltransferase